MKRFLKVIAIILASLIVVLVIAMSILTWFVFTPEKLTPIVRNELSKRLTCEVQMGRVELTFFSTFPEFGLRVDSFLVINPLPGAPTDTLLSAVKLIGKVDIATLWKHNEVIVHELMLEKPNVCVFVDSTGRANYNIMKPTPNDTAAFKLPFDLVNLEQVDLSDAIILYKDDGKKIQLSLNALKAKLQMTMKGNLVEGKLSGQSKAFSLQKDEKDYLKDTPLEFETPFTYQLKEQVLQLDKAKLVLNKLDVEVDALIQNQPEAMLTDIAFSADELEIKSVIDLLWLAFSEKLVGIDMNGKVAINGTLKGTMSDTTMPVFSLDAALKESTFAYEGMPYKLYDISGKVNMEMDMNDESLWFVKVTGFDAKTGKSHFTGSAFVDQLMGDMRLDINAKGNLNLVDAKPMLPENKPIKLKGLAQGAMHIKLLYSQIKLKKFDKIQATGKFKVKELVLDYDTLTMQSKAAAIVFTLPNTSNKKTSFMGLDVTTGQLEVQMGKHTKATLQGLDLVMSTSNMMKDNLPLSLAGTFSGNVFSGNMDATTALMQQPKGTFTIVMDLQDTTAIPVVDCTFDMKQLIAAVDTIAIDIAQPSGSFKYLPDPSGDKRPMMQLDYHSDQLAARIGKQQFDSKKINVKADVVYDATQKDFLLQWIPKGFVNLEGGRLNLPNVSSQLLIPAIAFDFTPDQYLIRDSRLRIDKSDFQLTGTLSNVKSYLKKEGLLMGDFNFRSNTTDINQLMKLTSGLGESSQEDSVAVSSSTGGPYMVPKGVDISLYTSINEVLFAKDTARNVQGNVTIKDGTLVMESMLFTTSAAKMQLTGMYRTPRKNHVYLGMDLHLLEIEIAELLNLIPDVDSIMPMLKSFDGKGEFHLVIETYLDSLYNLKKSTLRGASSIQGKNLVLMDGETFTEISKKLLFSKKTRNKVDSLSAEFTVFRNEVDVYPFLIVMDKYKAIVDGRHNLDMNFDYNICVIESPIPFKLGVSVTGNLDKMKFRLVKCKYGNMYRPARRTEVEEKKLELRKMIRDALTAKVREE